MELATLRNLRDLIRVINEHYDGQKTTISRLCEHASLLNTTDGQRLYPGIVVELHIDQDYFDVRFVGRCFRFASQLLWNTKEGPVTTLSCCEIFPTESNIKPKSIYKISIDQRGVTEGLSVDPPGNYYQADCADRNDALRLILQGVFSGLAEENSVLKQ